MKKIKILSGSERIEEKIINVAIIDAAEKLKYDHSLYFLPDAATTLVQTERLILSRAREEGIRNAVGFMAEAAAGRLAKRKPVEVVSQDDGHFRVVDGNSTATIALAAGWPDLPCIIIRDGDI
jgi:hypothetical protein